MRNEGFRSRITAFVKRPLAEAEFAAASSRLIWPARHARQSWAFFSSCRTQSVQTAPAQSLQRSAAALPQAQVTAELGPPTWKRTPLLLFPGAYSIRAVAGMLGVVTGDLVRGGAPFEHAERRVVS